MDGIQSVYVLYWWSDSCTCMVPNTHCLMYNQVHLAQQLCLETHFTTNKPIRNTNFSFSSLPLSLIWKALGWTYFNLAIPIYKTPLSFSHCWRRSHSTWYILWHFDICPSLPSHTISPSNLVTCYFVAHLSAMHHLNCEENCKKKLDWICINGKKLRSI